MAICTEIKHHTKKDFTGYRISNNHPQIVRFYEEVPVTITV